MDLIVFYIAHLSFHVQVIYFNLGDFFGSDFLSTFITIFIGDSKIGNLRCMFILIFFCIA